MIVQSGVKHVAVYWLKQPSDKEILMEMLGRLATLPQVESMVIGPPIDHDWPAMRIDSSWDVGFVAELRDKDACRDYFDDPLHQKLAHGMIDLVERVFPFYIDY